MNSKLVLEVPEAFDVEIYTSHFIRKDKRHGVIDAMHYVLDYINKDGLKKGDASKGASINIELLRKKTGKRSADDAIAILTKNGIIEKTKNYSALLKTSNKYKLSNKFPYGKTKKVEVLGKQLNASIKKSIEEIHTKEILIIDKLDHLTKFLKDGQFNFDIEKAKKTLFEIESRVTKSINDINISYKGKRKEEYYRKCRVAHLYKCLSMLKSISNAVNNKDVKFSRSSSNLRLNSDLTSMSKHLRGFFLYKGKSLTQLDLSASQPLILYYFLNSKPWLKKEDFIIEEDNNIAQHQYNKVLQRYKDNDTYMLDTLSKTNEEKLNQELERFGKLFDGDFYTEIINEIKKCNLKEKNFKGFENRNSCKKTMMFLLFEKFTGNKTNLPQYALFKNTFPVITKILDTLKSVQKNSVALILQRTESELFLDIITKQVAEINPEIPLFTIHDAILTSDDYVEIVNKIISDVFLKTTGINPKIKITKDSTNITEDQLKNTIEQYIIDIQGKVRKKEYASKIRNISTDELFKFIKKYEFTNLLKEILEYKNKIEVSNSLEDLFKSINCTSSSEDENNTPDFILDNGNLINFK